MNKILSVNFLILASIFLSYNQSKAQCNINDWTALKALYESTGGDNWTNRTGWNALINNQNAPPANCNLANLYGVELNNGRVVCLDFGGTGNCEWVQFGSGNQLVGNIPAELGNLSFLNYLSLYNNQLHGSIPPELGNLTDLTYFNAYANQLSGSIPEEIGSLNNLSYLDLSSNQLTGNIPSELGNLSNLTRLDLSSNQLNGNISPEIGNLGNLTFLNLNNNNLAGSILAELGNLSQLEILYLHNNHLIGSIPSELGNLTNLTTLYLHSNELSGILPAELGNLSNMTSLEIRNNNFTGCYESNLMNFCTQLTFLSDNGNSSISDGNNFDVPWEDFCSNNSGVCIPSSAGCHIDDWLALKALYESTDGNNWTNNSGWAQLSGSTPSANCNLGNLYGVLLDANGRVWCVDLDGEFSGNGCSGSNNSTGNNLAGTIPPELGNISFLDFLILSANNLTGNIPAELANLNNLRSLFLDRNQLSGCYDANLVDLCTSLTLSQQISDGNNFVVTWEDFCATGEGTCNCPFNLVINSATPYQNLYQSGGSITTSGSVEIFNWQQVKYRSNRVTLNQDFSVNAGADFKVRIGGCN